MSDIVIIGGPPGTGKTRLARGLASGYARGVHLEADRFFHDIIGGADDTAGAALIVVPRSGTDELHSIAGHGSFEADPGGTVTLELTFE